MAEDKGDCVEAVHLLYHYLDGELTMERRVLIRQHLDDCPPCGQAFDFEADLDNLFQFAKAAGVKVIYCLRLHNGDPQVDADTLAQHTYSAARRLLADAPMRKPCDRTALRMEYEDARAVSRHESLHQARLRQDRRACR